MFDFLLLLLAQATVPSLPPVDPARVAAEDLADADTLASLKRSGDISSIKRPIDVRFTGRYENIERLHYDVPYFPDWHVMRRVALDGGEEAIDFQIQQTTDQSAVRELTRAALRLEVRYGVKYDGWGTIATKR